MTGLILLVPKVPAGFTTGHVPNYFRVVIIFIEAMYFSCKNGFSVHGLLLYPLSYPPAGGEGFEPSTHKVRKTTSSKAACYTEFAVQHYGAIQKRSSGLILSVSSALPPDIVMEKDL